MKDMLQAIALALSITAPIGPPHEFAVKVNHHAILLVRGNDIRGWSTQSLSGRYELERVSTGFDKKTLRLWIRGTTPGDVMLDVTCGASTHELWHIRVRP